MCALARATSIRQEQADHTRNAILRAASREFSQKGFDGASTVAIMDAAQVNTSLLYYYFKSKSGLYEAVILNAVEEYVKYSTAILKSSASPAERVLRAALIHFDRYIHDQEAQRLLQQELLRFWSGGGEFASLLAAKLFAPWLMRMKETVEQGIEMGELRVMHWRHAIGAVLGANTFYFLNAPLISEVFRVDPLSKAEVDAQRRGMVEFFGQTLFVDPARGSNVAARVLANMPMPRYKKVRRGESRKME
jgi:TetR/AcrR family transcriptional regulator